MTNSPRRLRPMGTVEIINEAFDLYKSNFLLFIGIAAVFYIPFGLKNLLSGFMKSPAGWLPDMIMQPILALALMLCVRDAYEGKVTAISHYYGRSFKRDLLVPLFTASAGRTLVIYVPCLLPSQMIKDPYSAAAAVAGLLCLLMTPWLIYGSLKLALLTPVAVVEREGAGRIWARSWGLMKSNMGKAFWILAVCYIPYIFFVIIAGPITHGISHPSSEVSPFTRLAGTLVGILIAPMLSATSLLLYYDIRCRKEGLDVLMLAEQVPLDATDTK